MTRLELIIPGEQHFYVRAVNAAERQRWLVALGSSKAGTLDSHKHKGKSAMCVSAPCSSGLTCGVIASHKLERNHLYEATVSKKIILIDVFSTSY